ncbi:MAG: T9SS type A sorting domain-containing protein [Bacteroidetes bacterium]|nr:T9SS type A sorting domain-containing protein [Bacteroidota bacterium]
MKKIFFFTAIFLVQFLSAQKFIHPKTDSALTLTDMQKQFGEYKETHNLKKEKGWKYFKRFEMDEQMHTNGRGEVCDPTDYIRAAIDVAEQKQAENNSTALMNAWYPVGPNVLPNNITGYMENGIGRINCIAFHPTNASTYFVGVAQGGMWKTTNDGGSWTPLTDNLPITRISDIAIDPNDPDNTMYISVCDFEYIGFGLYLNGRKRNTHYGLGVYKTTDGGATWNPTGLTFQLTQGDASLIRRVIVDPANSNIIVACGVSGMYRSIDAGVTWTTINTGLFWDLQKDPVSSNILYAATGWVMNSNDGACSIMKSTDFGLTWTTLNTGIPATGTVQRIKLAIAPSDPNYVYAITCDTQFGLYGIYKSTNAGTSWSYIAPTTNVLEAGDGTSPGGQGTYDLAIMVNATNRNIIYTGGVNLYGSSDGGNTFDPASHWTLGYGPTIHGDIHFIDRNPVNGNIFVCSDGGVYRTTNIITQTWASANSGNNWPTVWNTIGSNLQITSFYRISSSRNAADRLCAGAQDNATFYLKNSAWFTIFGGDGMDTYLDPLNNSNVIGSSQYGSFYNSQNDGFSDMGTNPNMNGENAEWTSPLTADYNNPGTMYAGFQNVYKSTDNGFNWTQISNFTEPTYGTEISAIAVSNTNANTIYVTKRVRYEYNENGKIYKTTNGGGTWTNITANVPDTLYYTSVEISETDPLSAWVTLAGFAAGQKVYRTTNGGTSWANVSYNLPNIPVNCVKYIPGTGNVMIATDLGVYLFDAVNNQWVLRSIGLPNVICSDLEVNVNTNKIYVCTFGRGIWATDLDVFTNLQPTISSSLQMNLFPSPNNGTFTISLTGENSSSQELSLDVIDVMGRVVHSEKLIGKNSYEIKLDVLPGMYFAHVSGTGVKGVKSFVVE